MSTPTLHRASFQILETDFMMKARRVVDHTCSLQRHDEPIAKHIYDGALVNWRRFFMRMIMVKSEDHRAKLLFRSTAMIETEKHRHLSDHRSAIHPFSRFRQLWETFMVPTFFAYFALVEIELSNAIVYSHIAPLKFAVDITMLVDVGINFNTGYLDVNRQKVVLSRKKIAKRYLMSYFMFDCISSFPWSAIVHWGGYPHLYELKLLMLFKLVRLPTVQQYISNFCERQNWDYHKKGMLLFLGFLVLIGCATSYVFMTERLREREKLIALLPPMSTIFTSCFEMLRHFLLVGLGKKTSHEMGDMIFSIICLLIGCLLNMILLASLLSLYSRFTSARTKYANLMQQVAEYLRYKELPQRLRDRIFRYVNFKYRKHIFKEAHIMNNLSSILKQDLMLNNCKTMIERVEFFKELPTSAMLRLLSRLKSDIYLTNDVIVQAGFQGNAMFFIYNGTVAVYTTTGKEICHLSEGSHFGEIALVINEPRVATVVAIKECELFKLSRKDFHDALEPFPELTAKIRDLAMARLETTMKMMEQEKHDSLVLLPTGSNTSFVTEGSLMYSEQ